MHKKCERQVKTMTEDAKELRRQYYRAWSKAHPDRVKAHKEKYWENKARKLREAQEAQEAGKE